MSVLILGADGKSLLGRHIEPMTAEQVKWFCDPVSFLKNMKHLWSLKLRTYCQHCYKRGLQDDVHVRLDETQRIFLVVCSCSRHQASLPVSQVERYVSSTDELLRRLGWSLCCTDRCAKERGFADGVEANNDPDGHAVSIRCGCMERRYAMPSQSELVS